MSEIQFQIDINMKRLLRGLELAPREMERAWKRAGIEAAKLVVRQEGVKNYPAAPSTSPPPYPGYVRGIGYVSSDGQSDGSSERYGTQWNIRSSAYADETVLGNRASYSGFLGGEDQAKNINKNIPGRGWRRLVDVAEEKADSIGRIYNRWLRWALKKAGIWL